MNLVHRPWESRQLAAVLLCIGLAQFPLAGGIAAAQDISSTVRSAAVLDFGFEEAQGNPQSNGISAELKNAPRRVDSPFWGQSGRRAILLNAGRKHIVQIPDNAQTDRPQAVSLSLFFLSLHPLTDANFHGLVAKRAEPAAKSVTNYGINYHPQNDALQLYVNDGSGFKTVVYSVKDVLNSRRLAHLTAVWEVSDAPAADADTDKDDVRVRLFLNGKPVTPKTSAGGQIAGTDGWIHDINAANLLNDVPLTIGSSTLTTEFTSGVVDEFLLFDKALTDEQAALLFQEVAGDKASDLAAKEAQPPAAAVPQPKITATSLHGLQAGQPTTLAITGTNLGPNPRLVIPGITMDQEVLGGSTAARLNVKLTLPANSALGWFPLFVETDHGLSSPIPMAIDTLPQLSANTVDPAKPAALPAAFSGQLAGANIIKVYFRGKAGERVAAEVDARRLGAGFDPVVEIKTDRGTPLKIGWSETALRGDARAEVRLPADGVYFAELHDLTYKAPGQNRFRLRVGDFRSIDQWFPAKVAATEKVAVKPLGAGLADASALELTGSKQIPGEALQPKFMAGWDAVGPTPALEISQANEVLESTPESGLQAVDATFATQAHLPLAINGLIAKPGEEDRYLLNVTPGQKLRFTVEARSLPSPLDALLTVRNHPQGNVLVYKEDSGTARDPETEFTVPGGAKQIQVGVQDLHERGGDRFVYRLKIVPANAPDFSLTIKSESLTLPAEGNAVVEMQLARRGYEGPIRLRVAGDDSITPVPDEIPAGTGNRVFFITLAKKAGAQSRGFRGLMLIGESVGLEPELIRPAEVAGTPLPGHASLLPTMVTSATPVQIAVEKLPPALFKGVPATVKLSVQKAGDAAADSAVRWDLLTTELTRPNDPKDPKKGNKPKIVAAPYQAAGIGRTEGVLRITVPLDVAVNEIDAIVKAELVPHAYSDRIGGTVYSAPFKLPIKAAAALSLDNNTLNQTGGTEGKIQGTLQRTEGFAVEVTIVLEGLPAGYQTSEVKLAQDVTKFEIPITPAMETAAKTIKANIIVKRPNGGAILPPTPIELKIKPAS